MSVVESPIESPCIDHLEAAAYRIPTDYPEADGTLAWDATTLVTAHVRTAGFEGFGYGYAAAATADLIRSVLADAVVGRPAFSIAAINDALYARIRNQGRPGIAAMAIAVVDTALWDLKAKLLSLPLCELLGRRREAVPVYGSGGFTSYPSERLAQQLAAWVEQGIAQVKMKVGQHPEADVERVRHVREAIGPHPALLVDANGAYARKQALAQAEVFAESGVCWLEEPVSSDDLDGLRLLRDRAPAGMDITAGEYGFDTFYFRRMLEAGAVDVLQADATRCGGISGYLRAAALADAFHVPLSAHCAPALHLHPSCAVPGFRHAEHFHDHVRIEGLLFDGAPVPEHGVLKPDLTRPGLGIELKRSDAEAYRV